MLRGPPPAAASLDKSSSPPSSRWCYHEWTTVTRRWKLSTPQICCVHCSRWWTQPRISRLFGAQVWRHRTSPPTSDELLTRTPDSDMRSTSTAHLLVSSTDHTTIRVRAFPVAAALKFAAAACDFITVIASFQEPKTELFARRFGTVSQFLYRLTPSFRYIVFFLLRDLDVACHLLMTI